MLVYMLLMQLYGA